MHGVFWLHVSYMDDVTVTEALDSPWVVASIERQCAAYAVVKTIT